MAEALPRPPTERVTRTRRARRNDRARAASTPARRPADGRAACARPPSRRSRPAPSPRRRPLSPPRRPSRSASACSEMPTPVATPSTSPVPKEEPAAPTGRARARRARARRAAWCVGSHRLQHGRQPHRADRDQRAHRAGQAPHRQPRRDQQPPRPRPRRQGLVHPHHRVRAGQGAQGDARDERRLRGGRRQAQPRQARARQHRPRHRRGQARRHPPAAGAVDQGRRDLGFAAFWSAYEDVVRRARDNKLTDRGLPGHDRQPDQPGHDRHQPLGAAADERPGRHHRRRRDGLPARVAGRVRGEPRPQRDQQGHDADVDLRPPGHPGRSVR